MDSTLKLIAIIASAAIFGGSAIYVFRTKIEGFGPLTTALPIVFATLFFGSLALVFDKIDANAATNLVFTALGYGGGLLTTKLSRY